MATNENERQYRVVDQMLTAHSSLRDHYERRSRWLSGGMLAVAAILNAFVFAPDEILGAFGVPSGKMKIGIAIASAITFALSIIEFKADWSAKARNHSEAAQKLATLKARYRDSYEKVKGGDEGVASALSAEYSKTMEGIAKIPERLLAKLFAEHRFKRILNEECRDFPTCPVWFMKVKLRLAGIKNVVNHGRRRTREDQRKASGKAA